MLLAIDTSHGASVAVVDRDGGVLAEISVADRLALVESLGQLIRRVLDESATRPETLSGVAAGTGPGASADLNIGLAAAYGFASALGKPVVRVMSHDAVALDRDRPTLVISALADGRTVQTRYGAPDAELGLPVRETEPSLSADGDAPPGLYQRVETTQVSAGQLGMLAERLFAGGRSFAPKKPYSHESLGTAEA